MPLFDQVCMHKFYMTWSIGYNHCCLAVLKSYITALLYELVEDSDLDIALLGESQLGIICYTSDFFIVHPFIKKSGLGSESVTWTLQLTLVDCFLHTNPKIQYTWRWGPTCNKIYERKLYLKKHSLHESADNLFYSCYYLPFKAW